MPRKARIVLEDVPHHITQCGNNQQYVFFVDDDRMAYLELLKEHSQKFGLDLLAYCLMTNHVHIIAIPRRPDSLSKAIGRTHLRYTQYVNWLHKRSGHLWQNRFFSCPVHGKYLWKTIQYVENNPVRAGIVADAGDYKYSSAAAHISCRDPQLVVNMDWWQDNWQGDWSDYLAGLLESEDIRQIKVATSRGRPLASDSFLSKVEKLTGRRLRPLPVGRPKKRRKGKQEDE
jgi:putative transposase